MPVLANARQEKFVQGLIQGMSQRKAYRAAFKQSKRWKDATVDNKASKLFNTDEVKARYNELFERAEDKSIMSRHDRMWTLTKMIEDENKTVSNKDRIKAIDMLNKMENVYVRRTEVTGDMKIVNPYKGLTTEQLIKLADSGGADD